MDDDHIPGIGGEYFFDQNWSAQLNYLYSDSLSSGRFQSVLLGGRYYFDGHQGNSLFLSGDIARAFYPSKVENQFHTGIGINIVLSEHFSFSAEVRKVFSERFYKQDAISLLTLGYHFSVLKKHPSEATSRPNELNKDEYSKPVLSLNVESELVDVEPELKMLTLFFPFDSVHPISIDQKQLDIFVRTAKKKGQKIVISGHSDSLGSKTYNFKLSEKRALSVYQLLQSNYSIPSDNIKVVFYGETMPKADNGTAAGRALNRRVKLSLIN
ncbi:OmpA family protein [Vibrio sp. V27_P1S3P104]|nr:OmpA family protein [Vibrio sp. V30_P3S12P165]NAX37468.1 OmpA family protein [Vibrio sp. V27_P1S3P104]